VKIGHDAHPEYIKGYTDSQAEDQNSDSAERQPLSWEKPVSGGTEKRQKEAHSFGGIAVLHLF
jgi:hypothetical protein